MSATDRLTWEPYERLALVTVRLFHGLPEYFVMQALLNGPRQQRGSVSHPELQLDDKIAERLHMTVRYVRILLAKLKTDGLVIDVAPKVEEGKSAASQAAPMGDNAQKLYGIDFEVLADAVTYKLAAMDRRLNEQQAPKMAVYRCVKCGVQQKQIEVDFIAQVMPGPNGGLRCPNGMTGYRPECFNAELEEEDNSDARATVEAHRAALQEHTAGLQQALKGVIDLPPPTYKRPKDEPADEAGGSEAKAAASLRARSGGGGGGGGGVGSSLGASRGIAAAVGSGSGQQPLPAWMLPGKPVAEQSEREAAEQEQAAKAQAEKDKEAALDGDDFMKNLGTARLAASSAAALPLAAPPVPPASLPPASLPPGLPAGGEPDAGGSAEAMEEDGEDEGEEIPEVLVQGVSMSIADVVQSDIERMTEAEHQRYFEIYQELM